MIRASDKQLIDAIYSGLNLNQDKATKPQTVQIVRQGEVTPYWFKVNPLYKLNDTAEVLKYISLQIKVRLKRSTFLTALFVSNN